MANGYRTLAQHLAGGKVVYRKTWLDRNPIEVQNLLKKTDDFPISLPFIGMEGKERVLYERFCVGRSLIICGGGHISVPLSEIAKMLGYHVVVIDDRKEFASRYRFSNVDKVVCGEFSEILQKYNWEKYQDTSVVIVTRGHQADGVCLKAVLGRNLPYIGMIGSKKKNTIVINELIKQGFSEEELNKVHAPIGLKIGAKTPEEIAVAIAAELVSCRKDDTDSFMSMQMREALLSDESIGGVMATVVRKQGSVPRGMGARMLLMPNGNIIGTIGGGKMEYDIIQKMKQWDKKDWPLFSFDMSNDVASSSGMICGGEIEVLFEVI